MALRSTLDFFIEEVFRLPIRKVLDPNDPTDFAIISATLAKATAGLAQAEEAKALKAALAALDVDWKKMKPDAKLKVVNAAKAAVNPVKAVLPKLEEHFEANAIKLGIQTKAATKKTFEFSISPDLSAVQQKTLLHVALSQGNYVRDEYGKRSDVFGMKAKQIVAEELAKGSSQKDIVDRLHADLSAQQFNRSKAYWNVVSNAFANRARSYTNLSSYQEAGIDHFEFESVLDQRTSHVCRFMHGRKFPVAAALEAHAASEKPGGDVKTSMPWVTESSDADGNRTLKVGGGGPTIATVTDSAMGKVDETGTFAGMGNDALQKLGIMVPPLHGNCRSSILPVMGSHTVLAPSGPAPLVLTPSEATPEATPAAPTPAQAPPEEQEALPLPLGPGIAPKPLQVLPELVAPALKPVEVPALDPAAAPVQVFLPPKDKQQAALEKFAALKTGAPADLFDIGIMPNPSTVKDSPLLGMGKFGKPKDQTSQDAIDNALKKYDEGWDDTPVKHMPKKLGGLKSISHEVDADKVEYFIKNPKALAEAAKNGEIVAVKIGKDAFIVKGHEAVAAAHLLDKAELKILEVNLQTAKKYMNEKAAMASEALAAKPPPLAVPIPAKPKQPVTPWDPNTGALITPKPPPPPPPPVALGPPVDPKSVMAVKTGEAAGSNEGGFYTGADGVKRYVKFYQDSAQAHGEMLANAIYGALGNPSPESITWEGKFEKGNKKGLPEGTPAQMYASKLLDGKPLGQAGITKDNAKKFFDGFAADVLMANWDSAGASCDNAFLTTKGGIARIDNGGAFLMRAQAGRKKDGALNVIGEIESFFPGGSPANPGYHKLAEKAGYSSVEDFKDSFKKQVADITALKARHGSWSNFVSQYSPGLVGKDRDQIVQMLEVRHDLLQKKVVELYAPKPEKPKGGSGALNVKPSDKKNVGYREPPIDGIPPAKHLSFDHLPETKPPGGVGESKRSAPQIMPSGEDRGAYQDRANKALKKIKSDEKSAIEAFTGSSYGSIRDSEERGVPDSRSNAIQRAFKNATAEPGTVYRGIQNMPKAAVEAMIRHTDEDGPFRLGKNNIGATSSSAWRPDVSVFNFMGGPGDDQYSRSSYKVLFKIHQRSGIAVETISSVGVGECEVLLPRDAEFRVKQVAKWKGRQRVVIIELEEI